jgi:hypothetical protein
VLGGGELRQLKLELQFQVGAGGIGDLNRLGERRLG